MNIETKIFNGRITDVKQIERNGVKIGTISGYIATWDLDRGNEQFVKGAFAKSLAEHKKKNRQIRFKDHHGRTIGGYPINQVKEDDIGLFGIAEVNLEVQQGRELHSLARQGVIVDKSIGFTALEEDTAEDGRRLIKEAIVWEGSGVDEPMNEKANIIEVKSAIKNANTKEELKKALLNIKELPEDITNYLLEFFDEKLNSLTFEEIKPFENEHACRLKEPGQFIRFRRINNAGEVNNKRIDHIIGFKKGGGSEIQSIRYPKSIWEASDARSHCGSRDGKFEAAKKEMIIAIDDLKSLTERELEGRLTKGGAFSSKTSKVIIATLKAAGLRDEDNGDHRDDELDWSDVVADLKQTKQLLEGKTND